jgi:hemerythrin
MAQQKQERKPVMAAIMWKDDYSVGIGAMDTQHKQLITLINQLYEAMQKSATEEAMKTVLPGLLKYTKIHFAAEEKLIGEAGYPELEAHQAYHRQFTATLTETIEKCKSTGIMPTVSLVTFLKDWLSNHILVKDKHYGAFISSHQTVGAAK